ncbi:crosslink repair DNA glycosylase YcaQ family protein [Actinopolymorpha sp. B17G11]|uniref:winged helix-turn-helix domain-containing protein n=1 Tax=Actinopolymorpha sp. B17G11 TaxID=3160861 RepID=UPI0032E509C2
MRTSTPLSAAAARRIALAAQGFLDPRPAGRVDARHIQRVVNRVGYLQLDALNVLCRMHYATLFGRLGPYPRRLLDRLAWGDGRQRALFEYWGNAATLLPVSMHPLFRWRMKRAAEQEWSGSARIAQLPAGYVREVLAVVAERGPISAGEIGTEGRRPGGGGMFNWSHAKVALEWLFITGQVSIAARPHFTRMYDLTERVLPPEVLAMPTPTEEDAQRELIRLAARALGVATAADLRNHWFLPASESKVLVASLVEAGELLPVRVEGWRGPAYVWHQARIPRRVHVRTLLSPFDPVFGGQLRCPRLFQFDHHIEFYKPKEKRVYGYFVLPFLLGDRPVGRVDLRADRTGSALVVQAAHAEPGVDEAEVAAELAVELRHMADWLGLDRIVVTGRGSLGSALVGS